VCNKEFLAVVESCKKWRHYLYGKHFQIVTDHDSLRHIPAQSYLTPRQICAIELLAELDYEIIYHPGKLNPVADALSRRSDLKIVASSTLPIANGTLPIANGTLPTANGTLPTINGTLPIASSTLPIASGTLSIANDTITTANGTTPTIDNTKSALKNKDPKSEKSQPVLLNEPPLKALPNLAITRSLTSNSPPL
jgi:hypothetical protein